MSRGQNTGIILMAGAVLSMVLFVIGTARRSYLALALPIMAAISALAALTFWLGWTMTNMEDEEEAAPAPPELP